MFNSMVINVSYGNMNKLTPVETLLLCKKPSNIKCSKSIELSKDVVGSILTLLILFILFLLLLQV